ncbi:hypothetical protein Pcinc_000454 [Petrolisthes cinctipes]|uniref:Uncharacterized protein n=1 Tax=Petrolisthes cinctipes TaxID=88211 RepID=A0AAE1L412_PETCI|nr:hypothetical protein Pcinc_000454 [Petrolisthes cinctipes]
MFGRQHRPIDQEFEVNEELELEVEEAGLAPPEDDVDTSCTFEDYVRLPTTEEVSLFVQKQEQKRQQLHIKRDEKVELAQQKQKAEYNRRKQKGVKSYALEVGMQILDIDSSQRVTLEAVKNGRKLSRRVPYNQLRPYLRSKLHDARYVALVLAGS